MIAGKDDRMTGSAQCCNLFGLMTSIGHYQCSEMCKHCDIKTDFTLAWHDHFKYLFQFNMYLSVWFPLKEVNLLY